MSLPENGFELCPPGKMPSLIGLYFVTLKKGLRMIMTFYDLPKEKKVLVLMHMQKIKKMLKGKWLPTLACQQPKDGDNYLIGNMQRARSSYLNSN